MCEERENKHGFEQERRNLERLEMELEASCETTSPERLAELVEQNGILSLLVAQNSATPAPILEELAKEGEPSIREAVTRNPNSPIKVLLELGEEFPQGLLENPIFPLLWLENPNFIEQISPKTLVQLLELPQGRETLLDLAAHSSSFSNRHYTALILSNTNCELHWLEHLAQNPHEDIRVAIVSNPKSPLEILERFANDASSWVRARLAEHPNVSVSLLEKLAWDVAFNVRAAVARNPQVPVSILEELATDSQISIRWSVAANPKTPYWILDLYGEEADSKLVLEVAQNPSISLQLLKRLLQSSKQKVRMTAACNPRMTVCLFQKNQAFKSKELWKQIALATRSVEIIEFLERETQIIEERALTNNPQIYPMILESSGNDKLLEVRLNIARNGSIPVAISNILADSCHARVRRAVAKNINTEISVFKRLTMDRDKWVRRAAKANLQRAQSLSYDR